MNLIESIDQIRELVASIRAKRLGFITNFFLDEEKHQLWIEKGVFFYAQISDSLFFIKKNNGFCNAFYSSTTAVQLAEDLKELNRNYPDDNFVFDIIGRDIQCQPVVEAFQQAGYAEFCSLKRMSRITPEESYNFDEAVSYAAGGDVKAISALLHSNFNEEAEQIPYDEELNKYAANKQILVCKMEGQIAGFLIYEKNASTLYLRYWFTNSDFRDKKVGSKLLRAFFKIGEETKRQQLWVIQSNENAIVRYEHYGFKEENMYDIILSNKHLRGV